MLVNVLAVKLTWTILWTLRHIKPNWQILILVCCSGRSDHDAIAFLLKKKDVYFAAAKKVKQIK